MPSIQGSRLNAENDLIRDLKSSILFERLEHRPIELFNFESISKIQCFSASTAYLRRAILQLPFVGIYNSSCSSIGSGAADAILQLHRASISCICITSECRWLILCLPSCQQPSDDRLLLNSTDAIVTSLSFHPCRHRMLQWRSGIKHCPWIQEGCKLATIPKTVDNIFMIRTVINRPSNFTYFRI